MLTSNKEVEEIVSFALPERNVKLGILEPITSYHAVFDAPKKSGRGGHFFFASIAVFNQSGTRTNINF